MVRPNSAAQVIYDSSVTHGHVIRSHSRPSAEERHNFMSMNLIDMYQKPVPKEQLDSESEEMDMQKILKAVEYMGATTWKDRKALENQKVVALGGKPPKKHRTPLNVGRKVDMKRKKRKEEKKLEEDRILGKHSSNNKREMKEKPESRVLKASEGHFRNGVLNVKHLLKRSSSSRSTTVPLDMFGEGKKKGKGKVKGNKGKGKGKGRKGKNGRH